MQKQNKIKQKKKKPTKTTNINLRDHFFIQQDIGY